MSEGRGALETSSFIMGTRTVRRDQEPIEPICSRRPTAAAAARRVVISRAGGRIHRVEPRVSLTAAVEWSTLPQPMSVNKFDPPLNRHILVSMLADSDR